MFSLPFECEFYLLKLASTPKFTGIESENQFFTIILELSFHAFLIGSIINHILRSYVVCD